MKEPGFGHHFLRLSLISMACCALLGVVGYFPTARLVGPTGIGSMIAGIGISLLAGMLGMIPVCLTTSQSPDKAPTAILGATCIRFLVVLFLTACLVFTGYFDRTTLVVWVVISYLALLLADTIAAVWLMNATRKVSR